MKYDQAGAKCVEISMLLELVSNMSRFAFRRQSFAPQRVETMLVALDNVCLRRQSSLDE